MKTMFFALLFCLSLGSFSQAYILSSPTDQQLSDHGHGGNHGGGHGGGNHGGVHHPPHHNPIGHGGPHGGGYHYGGNHYGHYYPAPGWHHTYVYNYHYHPHWWYAGMIYPAWYWSAAVPYGYWQCTAFNQNMTPFYATGTTEHQAAFNAMYACGGPNAQALGCYVPETYCRLR